MQCHWCKKEIIGQEITKDHVIPQAFFKRGIIKRDNCRRGWIVPCCYGCNQDRAKITGYIMSLYQLWSGITNGIYPSTYVVRRLELMYIARLGPHFLEWNY